MTNPQPREDNTMTTPNLTLAEARAIIEELREPPRWMTRYAALPAFMQYMVEHFDEQSTNALIDELKGLLIVDTDQADRTNACNAFADRWSGHNAYVVDWWLLVADWLDRPR